MELAVIAHVRGGFTEKFGTPRQPGLAPHARAEVVLVPPYDHPDTLRGLAGTSHVWLVFGFDRSAEAGWRPTVRPPRLGGNRRVGVFASRSPFRPNAIGLSAVELIAVHRGRGERRLVIGNHDLVDGTPVYDIRPYIPYCDARPDARAPAGFESAPRVLPVRFEPEAEADLAGIEPAQRALLEEVLAQDPRPAYRAGDPERRYALTLGGRNVRWRVEDGTVIVESVETVPPRDAAPKGRGDGPVTG